MKPGTKDTIIFWGIMMIVVATTVLGVIAWGISRALHMSTLVYAEIRRVMALRTMTCSTYGVLDEVFGKIIGAVEKDEQEVTLQYKTEVDDAI